MVSFHCETLTLIQHGESENLNYEKAILFIHFEEDGFKSWFVDITSLKNGALLHKLLNTSDIEIYMKVLTTDGTPFEGEGFIHPNLSSNNATIRGHGELIGYDKL